MKHILFLLIAVLLCSCEQENDIDYAVKPKTTKQVSSNYNTTYNVVEIDSCEYLVKHSITYYNFDVISITHKGNCKYCLERNKQMFVNALK